MPHMHIVIGELINSEGNQTTLTSSTKLDQQDTLQIVETEPLYLKIGIEFFTVVLDPFQWCSFAFASDSFIRIPSSSSSSGWINFLNFKHAVFAAGKSTSHHPTSHLLGKQPCVAVMFFDSLILF